MYKNSVTKAISLNSEELMYYIRFFLVYGRLYLYIFKEIIFEIKYLGAKHNVGIFIVWYFIAIYHMVTQ